ncbi:MAG: hypothetical protein IPN13_06340 [Bacteroidetes bacterium]|nr:hypothetical protein [Bacteroidota bacterium]
MQTGDNGRFVGYRSSSRFADRCRETRIQKLWKAIIDNPKIKQKLGILSACSSIDDVKEVLENLNETEIWKLFDGIKERFGLRIFGKGYMYRIIPDSLIFDVATISEKQKLEGIKGKELSFPMIKGQGRESMVCRNPISD